MLTEQRIYDLFVANGYQWKIDEKLVTPTVEQIRDHIDRMKAAVDDDEQIASGRIIVIRTKDKYDIFVMIAEEGEQT